MTAPARPCALDGPFTVETPQQVDTAGRPVWCMHLTLPAGLTVSGVLDDLLATGAECLTGWAAGGDSADAWCELADDHEPRALHVDFTAPSWLGAHRIAAALADLIPQHPFEVWDVTGAEDWSLHDEASDRGSARHI